MVKDISRFLLTCERCLAAKAIYSPIKLPMRLHDKAPGPFSHVVLDAVGPLKPSKSSQCEYVQVLVDVYSRWCIAWPSKEIKAARTLKEMFTRLFCVYGVPEVIYTDNSTNYKNNLFSTVFSNLGIKHIFGSPWHPQAQGLVERYNKTIKESVRTLIDANQTNWCEFISPIVFAMNVSEAYSLGYSPYLLLFGRNAPLPPANSRLLDADKDYSTMNWFIELSKHRDSIVQAAHDNLEKTQAKMVDRHNQNLKPSKFETGDIVFLKNEYRLKKGTTMSLQDLYRGPYLILDLPSASTATIKNLDDGSIISPNVHIKRLKRVPQE